MFSVATWNVNSLKVRLPQVIAWLQEHPVDVLALQETKLTDEKFPCADFEMLGYHPYFIGQSAYNGVALISRWPAEEITKELPDLPTVNVQQRFIALTIKHYRVISVYVPNGSSVGSEKYFWKLQWLTALNNYLKTQLSVFPNVIIMGDYNIAPDDLDVHDPVLWREQILCSTPEREAFQSLVDLNLTDLLRSQHPEERIYTWWDYRQAAFRRDLGLRIDHILTSAALQKKCVSCSVDKTPRQHERPSDHIPVIATFAE